METGNGVGEAARRLRPAGYAALGVVWLALTIVSLLLWAALPAILAATAGSLHDSPGITSLRGDPSNLTAFILTMIILPPFFVYALLAITVGCASLTALAFIYAGRARNPLYNDRKLSRTDYAVDAIGPPLAAFLPKALSLLPTWRSPGTDALAALTTLAFRPGFRLVGSAWVLGVCYFFTIGWALWPVHGAVLAVCVVISAVLAALGVWLLIRSAVVRYRALSTELNAETDAAAAKP